MSAAPPATGSVSSTPTPSSTSTADVTDRAQVVATLAGATRVIHLAGLQIPFCRADPSRGAAVNVIGTVNVFEAVKESGTIRGPVVFASSVAAFAGDDDGTEPRGRAATHYGVYKRANEGTAQVVPAGRRDRVDRVQAVLGVRRRARPGRHRARRRGRCWRRPAASRTRSRSPAPAISSSRRTWRRPASPPAGPSSTARRP